MEPSPIWFDDEPFLNIVIFHSTSKLREGSMIVSSGLMFAIVPTYYFHYYDYDFCDDDDDDDDDAGGGGGGGGGGGNDCYYY